MKNNIYHYMDYSEKSRRDSDNRFERILACLPKAASDTFRVLDQRQSGTRNTLTGYAGELKSFFEYLISAREEFKSMNITDISFDDICTIRTEDIENYISYIQNYTDKNGRIRVNKSNAQRRKRSALYMFFNFLVEEGYITENPAVNIKTVKGQYPVPKDFLTAAEAEKLLSGMSHLENSLSFRAKDYYLKTKYRDIAIIALLVYCRLSITEIISIDRKNINYNDSTLIVTEVSGRSRSVNLPDFILEFIDTYMLESRSDVTALTASEDEALFLSMQKRRINARSIENISYKYSYRILGRRIAPQYLTFRD